MLGLSLQVRPQRSVRGMPAGAALWFDASDASTLYQDAAMSTPVTTNAQPIGAWRDKSRNGRHVTAATAAKRGVYLSAGLNGRPVVASDAAGTSLTNASFTMNQPSTILVVGRYRTIIAQTGFMDGQNSVGRNLVFLPSTLAYGFYAGSTLPASGVVPDLNAHIHSMTANGSTSLYRLDGVQYASGNVGAMSLQGITVLNTLFSAYSDVVIGELIVYNRLLSGRELSNAEDYLRTKWAI